MEKKNWIRPPSSQIQSGNPIKLGAEEVKPLFRLQGQSGDPSTRPTPPRHIKVILLSLFLIIVSSIYLS